MKNYALSLLVAVLFLSSCYKKDMEQAQNQRDSLLAILNTRDSTLGDFLTTFNDVERNLDSITVRQNLVSKSAQPGTELNRTQKDRINDQISAINNLMDENRKKIAELNKKLKASGGQNAQLKKTIATLNYQLTQKEGELASLNEKLTAANAQVAQLQTSVDTLTASNTSKSQTIAEQTATIHTAYYVVGQSKALKDAKVIDKTGGFIGIGRTSSLNRNVDNSKFVKIDMTQTTSIPVNGKSVKIITSHPADSYTLDTDTKDKNKVNTIIINNPEKFWSASKYLVVVKQ